MSFSSFPSPALILNGIGQKKLCSLHVEHSIFTTYGNTGCPGSNFPKENSFFSIFLSSYKADSFMSDRGIHQVYIQEERVIQWLKQ